MTFAQIETALGWPRHSVVYHVNDLRDRFQVSRISKQASGHFVFAAEGSP